MVLATSPQPGEMNLKGTSLRSPWKSCSIQKTNRQASRQTILYARDDPCAFSQGKQSEWGEYFFPGSTHFPLMPALEILALWCSLELWDIIVQYSWLWMEWRKSTQKKRRYGDLEFFFVFHSISPVLLVLVCVHVCVYAWVYSIVLSHM